MLRPEVVKQLTCPSVGLATSWTIKCKNVPCESLQEVRTGFRRELWPFAKGKIAKSDTKAKSLREQGNAAYSNAPNDPANALQLYNQAICMAEDDSEELALGYANRSAIYFNRKLYLECLQNIELAKRNPYPEQLRRKLSEREERCRKALEKAGEKESPEVAPGTSPSHCSLKPCLEMTADECSIRTSRDLSVGEKVLLERPFVLVLEAEVAYARCDYCGACNEHNLRPCKHCTAVMYCSEECQEQALQRYHQFECEIIDDLQLLYRGPKATRVLQVALRLFWLGILLYLEAPEQFVKRLETPEELAQFRDPFALEPSDYLLHLLASFSEEEHHEAAQDQTAMTGKCVNQFLTILTYVVAVEENESLSRRLVGLPGTEKLHHLLYQLIFHSDKLADYNLPDATGYYPFTRLLSHSCAPNSERIKHDLQTIIVVKRPIAKHQPITIAYRDGLTTERMIKSKRQETCQKEHHIKECVCEGCLADYPVLEKIEKDETLEAELETIRNSTSAEQRKAILADFLQRHESVYPKRELYEAWALYRPFVTDDL
ncbi:uncharacterized protein LOC125957137 [Anopheles darlingi]|uniref:uncharacterized protein LOC125957137 n=1 Tax=Anopheles darlingi TaxID=43151 RepID=UPI0021005A1C|nr:uncharacterized protein LOC125957137 [Anopheles darlingi]